MTMSQPHPISLNDVLLLLGQATVELAIARQEIAELRQQLESRSNGQVHPSEELSEAR